VQLKIYRFSLDVVGEVTKLVTRIGRHDPDLARQLRRAAPSIPLNLAEGESALGGNRRTRFDTAKCSAKESIACLEVAVAMNYLAANDIVEPVNGLSRIVATITVLNRRG